MPSDLHPEPVSHDESRPPASVKVVISGGFGVGKTTFVGAISEIDPITTEAAMTDAAADIDDQTGVGAKTTTTVALDFGRITLDESLVLYLFGTPGQDRFVFLWDDVVDGALGAIVLVDTRRIDQCYHAVDYLERRSMPFVVAVNRFEGAAQFDLDEVREALDVPTHVPIINCDARNRAAVKTALTSLIEYLMQMHQPPSEAPLEPTGATAHPAPGSDPHDPW